MRGQGVVQGGAGGEWVEAGSGHSRPAIVERGTGVVDRRGEWVSVGCKVGCKVGKEVGGARRAVVTAGQRSGDVAGLSEVQGIDTVASGRVSITIQGTSMGQGRPPSAYCMVPLGASKPYKAFEKVIAAVGSRVRIKELKARPECNGLEGTVKALLPDERLWVVLDSGDDLNVAEAIIIAVGSRVRIEGLISRPECNGLEGTVRALLPDERLWVVLENGEELNVSAGKTVLINRNNPVRGTSMQQNTVGAEENTGRGRRKLLETAEEEGLEKAKRKQIMAEGSRVRIERLISRPECNGLEGTVRALLPDERLWVVLDDGGELNVSFGKTVLINRDAPVRAEPLLIELEEADTVW
jgi:translation initiation factor IF-1